MTACLTPAPGLVDYPFNVRRYGATGNGTTDDTAAIQCAIDAAEAVSSGAGGAVVYFPGGNYLVSATLTVEQQAVSLLGAGVRSTSITRAAGFTSGDTILVRNATTPADFTRGNNITNLAMRATSETSSGAHIHLINSHGAAYSDLQLEDQYGGILVQGGVDLHFTNTRIYSDRYFPTYKAGSYFVTIEDASPLGPVPLPVSFYFTNANWQTSFGNGTIEYGLRIHSADQLQFTNVHILGTAVANILMAPASGRQISALRFSNCYIDQTHTGGTASVLLQGQTSAAYGLVGFDGCVFWGGSGSTGVTAPTSVGVLVAGGTSLKGLSITDSSISGYGSHGIQVGGGSNFLIGNNQISNNNSNGAFGAGVQVGAISDFQIVGNTIGTTQVTFNSQHNYSVVVSSSASNRYTITGNTLLNNINASISDAGLGPKKLVANNLLQ